MYLVQWPHLILAGPQFSLSDGMEQIKRANGAMVPQQLQSSSGGSAALSRCAHHAETEASQLQHRALTTPGDARLACSRPARAELARATRRPHRSVERAVALSGGITSSTSRPGRGGARRRRADSSGTHAVLATPCRCGLPLAVFPRGRLEQPHASYAYRSGCAVG